MPLSVLRIGDEPAFVAVVEQALREISPETRVLACADVAAATAQPVAAPHADQLLVLCDPTPNAVTHARNAMDAAGLPRWAVVILGETPDNDAAAAPDVVGRESWQPALVARVMLSALAQHRLERENARLRGDLATIGFRIAHDLRTPLGGVMTTTEMLREILSEDTPQHVPLTQPILDSTEGLVKLIDQMSFFAKTMASREPAQRLSMSQPFWNAYQRLEGALTKAGATLVQPADWPMVQGHADWLEVIWRNLLGNAVEHGGVAVKIEAGWERQADGIRFFVRDSGNVPSAKRAGLFHPFERRHEPGAPRGLGLAMTQRLVELEGGRCEFEALPGGGSAFSFVLPSAGN